MAVLLSLEMALIGRKSHLVEGSARMGGVYSQRHMENTYIGREGRSKAGRHSSMISQARLEGSKGAIQPLLGNYRWLCPDSAERTSISLHLHTPSRQDPGKKRSQNVKDDKNHGERSRQMPQVAVPCRIVETEPDLRLGGDGWHYCRLDVLSL